MKKAGIVTLYYNNINYGGMLQAAATVKMLENIGVNAEQISYQKNGNHIQQTSLLKRMSQYSPLKLVKLVFDRLHWIYIDFRDKSILKKNSNNLIIRRNAFLNFMESIPHTQLVDDSSIYQLDDNYDFYVSGSDQVWNPAHWSNTFFLKFTDKKKMSYAASLGVDNLSQCDSKVFKEGISDIDIITVRENSAKELVEKYTDKTAKVVLDPTLMLKKTDWEQYEKPYDVNEKYILCYLLGKNKQQHKLIRKFAKEKSLKIVYLPFSQRQECYKDKDFGDIRLYDVGPAEFLYLIHNAQYVVTDSFHAVVFSLIYNKEFYVLNRYYGGRVTDNGRVLTLLSTVNLQDRFVLNKTDIDKCQKIKWENKNEIIAKKQSEIYEFLKKTIQEI